MLVEDDEQGVIPAELFFDEETWEPEGTVPPELLVATDGEEFVKLVEEHGQSIEVIITDIALSDDPTHSGKLSGVDYYSNLRERIPDVPCIAITGRAPDSEAIKALKSGVLDYVKKPFSWNQLWSEVERLVAVVRLNRSRRLFQEAVSKILSTLKTIEEIQTPALSRSLVRKIVEVAVLACQAEGGWLFLADADGNLKFEMAVGYSQVSPLPNNGLFQDVFKTGMEQCFYLTGEEDTSSLADFESDKRALLCVPLLTPTSRLGVLSLARGHQGRPFTPDQVSLMNQFAVVGGITVEAHRRESKISELLIRAMRTALDHSQSLNLESSMSALEQEAEALDGGENSFASNLKKLRRAGPQHVEFWAETLSRYCQTLVDS